MQFLLAEFATIRELRSLANSIVERRIQFIITLQAAETAFIGVLLSQHASGRIVTAVALVLGLPTLLLTYITYLRALDFQIQSRKYIWAMNAIRRFFVNNDPVIEGALLLSTDPRFPRMGTVGHAGSLVQGFAAKVLILTMFFGGMLSFAAIWLVLASFSDAMSTESRTVIAVVGASVIISCATPLEIRRSRLQIQRAEAQIK